MPLRLIFMGTPEFAVPTLLELVAQPCTPARQSPRGAA
jgi:methionyl-tRNA formyltransferase